MATEKNKTEAKNAKNTAPNANANAPAFELPDFEKWEKEQVGFAPYWNPKPGEWFYGAVVARDERDPEFVRYLVKTYMPMTVHRGAKDENGVPAETVEIQPGDMFTISDYYSLTEVFNFILEHFLFAEGKEVPMRIKAVKEVKTKKPGQTCWTWEMLLPPEFKKKLADKRHEVRLKQIEADRALAMEQEERAALQGVTQATA